MSCLFEVFLLECVVFWGFSVGSVLRYFSLSAPPPPPNSISWLVAILLPPFILISLSLLSEAYAGDCEYFHNCTTELPSSSPTPTTELPSSSPTPITELPSSSPTPTNTWELSSTADQGNRIGGSAFNDLNVATAKIAVPLSTHNQESTGMSTMVSPPFSTAQKLC